MIERDGSAKGIVFSQFTSFLDLIHYSLQKVNACVPFLWVLFFFFSVSSLILYQRIEAFFFFFLQSGVCCVQLVGSMSMAARDAAIKKFTDDPECRIFVMSLKAGGVALNLTVASHVSTPFLIG